MSTTESSSLILWGAESPRALRDHWTLAELGLDYESRPIHTRTSEMKSAEFTALTARQKIPLLQDGDFTITESAAISIYLSDAYAMEETALVPRGTKERAKCLEWCFFAMTELDATSLYIIRRHRDLAAIYGAAPAVCDAASAYFVQQMRSVERALSENPNYLVGDRITAADILLSTCISWAVAYHVPVAPLVLAYNTRLTNRPAYAKASLRNAA
jgi:glutathione S-transferase